MILRLVAGGLGGLASLPYNKKNKPLLLVTFLCSYQHTDVPLKRTLSRTPRLVAGEIFHGRATCRLLTASRPPVNDPPGLAAPDNFPVSRLRNALVETFLITLIQEGKTMSLLAVHYLATDTIKSYRSKLRRLWLSLPTLGEDDACIARQKIAQLEQQLGIKAADVPGPGRPRRFSGRPALGTGDH